MSTPSTQTSQTQPDADPFHLGYRYVWQENEKGEQEQVQIPLTPEDVLHPQEGDFIVHGVGHDRDCAYLRDVLEILLDGRDGSTVTFDVRTDWEISGLKPHGPDLVVYDRLSPGWDRVDIGTMQVKTLGAVPVLVIEVTSPSTRNNDLGIKVEHYQRAGIPFYAIVDYDPDSEERQVHVLGYRHTPDGFVRLPLDERGFLWIEPLRIWLGGEGNRAVCFDEHGQRIQGICEAVRAQKQLAMQLDEQRNMTEEAILDRIEVRRELEKQEKARKEAELRAADEVKARKEAELKAADEEKARKLAEARAGDEEKARKESEAKAADETKARKLAEAKAADEEKVRKETEQKAADLAAKLADLEAELRRLHGESTS